MCGLTGFWLPAGTPAEDRFARAAASVGVAGEERHVHLEHTVRSMADALVHRGPDDAGTFVDARAGLALGHRRLSILDLSSDGRQPMSCPGGRYTLAYNGEVYNFAELRGALEARGVRFRTRTDTEVVLHALIEWGVEQALSRLIGMFAIAFWDAQERSLVLARDRVGIKPLYYATQDGGLSFGSELKVLRRHPAFRAELDRDALTQFFRFNYVPAPHAIYRDAKKLLPGSFARITADSVASGCVDEVVYWDPREVAARGTRSISAHDAEEALDELLREAVGARTVSDVPLGAFLSGGIDSSLVVAYLQQLSDRPAQTYTIGFREEGYDEAAHARAVAEHLGTEHHELTVTPEDALAVIPGLARTWDEPFADSSQIPTAIVSRFARSGVTVCLSGDGGDELFGGYPRYFLTERLRRGFGRVPRALRGLAAGSLRAVPGGLWEGLARRSSLLRRKGLTPGWASYRMQRLADLFALTGDGEGDAALYRSMVSHWKEPERLVLGGMEPEGVHDEPLETLGRGESQSRGPGTFSRMMLVDTLTYLPDDILCKVDRASMACALEARVPLLDHRVLEFAWSLPHDVRVGPEPGKGLLRRLLARHVPRELFERPKMGFGIPIAAWLRGPLREWGEELLDPKRLADEGILSPEPVREAWDAHQSGRASLGYYLWDLLAFQAWHEVWLGREDIVEPPAAMPSSSALTSDHVPEVGAET